MKNPGKTRPAVGSYSASEAGSILGVSIPTVKRMATDRRVESFRTPGGHLRIVAESIQNLRDGRPPRATCDPSPILQNRRERLEELTLQAQEMRAKRDIGTLRREDAEEAERERAERDAKALAAAEREEALELEKQRLERQGAQERARRDAERRLAAFHCQWRQKASESLSAPEYRWLSAAQRKEILDAVESQIENGDPSAEARMTDVIACAIAALLEPMATARRAGELRKKATEASLRGLPYFGTNDADRARAAAAIRDALSHVSCEAEDYEFRAAAEGAVQAIRQAVERRLLNERLLRWGIHQLPWEATDQEKRRLRRQCAEILAELPEDVSEAEARDALESAISEARQEIEERTEKKRTKERKAILIRDGVAQVSFYLLRLKQNGEITAEEYRDPDFTADLKQVVRGELESELSGDEDSKEVRELVQEIIEDELE